MTAVVSPATVGGGLPTAIDPFALSLNENPFPPLPTVRSALIRSIDAANRYPEFLPQRLRYLIANQIGASSDQVVLGSGATGVVMQVLYTLTGPGDRIVMATPTFDGYPILAQIARLTAVTVPLDQHGHQDLDAMADAAAAGAKVVVVCRPHNPTGTLGSVAELIRFLRRIPSQTIVVLDEAYIEFAAPQHRVDAAALVGRFPNVVVVRTFSKAYGLAGLRIGYGVTSAELSATLWTSQLPFGTAITSLLAVAASFAAEKELRQRIRRITAERRYLSRRLRALGVYNTDAHANFVYLPAQGRRWPDVFAATGLRIRFYPDGAARITVGNRESTKAVLSAVANCNGADMR